MKLKKNKGAKQKAEKAATAPRKERTVDEEDL